MELEKFTPLRAIVSGCRQADRQTLGASVNLKCQSQLEGLEALILKEKSTVILVHCFVSKVEFHSKFLYYCVMKYRGPCLQEEINL